MAAGVSATAPIVLDATSALIQRPRDLQKQLPSLREGGVDVVSATVSSVEDFPTVAGILSAWADRDAWSATGARQVRDVADARAVKAADQIGVILHAQGLNAIGSDVSLLDMYAAFGVRVAQLTYNTRNLLAEGCLEPANAGLSEAGRKAVRRLNALGVAVDISHTGEASSAEILRVSDRPVVASHSNARALCDSPRNLSDALIRGVAASGGVIGLAAFPAFVAKENPTVAHLAEHAAYMADLVGAEHVGMGLDFAESGDDESFAYDDRYYPRPPWIWPTGLESSAGVPNLAQALRDKGFSTDEIHGILGENFMRVFGQVWS
ncbi:MAG: peptidase renal dipeptidase [Blastococcus sp.]|jgi:membrane dipeptidase|nr:peptidase renal dipeptidase [Blastococcus sp.]